MPADVLRKHSLFMAGGGGGGAGKNSEGVIFFSRGMGGQQKITVEVRGGIHFSLFRLPNFQLGHLNESVIQKAVTISRKGTLRPDLVSRTGIFI